MGIPIVSPCPSHIPESHLTYNWVIGIYFFISHTWLTLLGGNEGFSVFESCICMYLHTQHPQGLRGIFEHPLQNQIASKRQGPDAKGLEKYHMYCRAQRHVTWHVTAGKLA